MFELRPRGRAGIGRAFYCFLVGKRVIVLHAFIKKTQQTPDSELKLARKRLKKISMADLKFKPVRHQHDEFLAKAKQRAGFAEAYESLELEYALANQMLKARAKAGLTQDAVAERMGTTKESAISRLEAAGGMRPRWPRALKKYAAAVGCDLQVKLVRRSRPEGRAVQRLP